MLQVKTEIGLSLDEFVRLYDQAPFELIDGERRLIMPSVKGHSEIIKFLFMLLLRYEAAYGRVSVYSETTYLLTYTPDWVTGSRVPDIMVYLADRIVTYEAQTPDHEKKPFILVPDLCIEVISPDDKYMDVDDEIDSYLKDGVRLVWLVNPRHRTVSVYTAGSNQFTRLTVNDALTGGDVLPEFTLPLQELFRQ